MSLAERDQAILWHPYTQHKIAALPIPIVRGSGAYLIGENNKRYLDLISSWWVNAHGHCHPEIAKAIYEQAMTLEHVLFAGFTHEPAVSLAEKILALLPVQYTKVFYSDNGSTAVEVALKMAYQYWRNLGEPERKRFIAFDGGYHGDTFGAMAVGKQSGFFGQYLDLLFDVDYIPFPGTWEDDEAVLLKEQLSLNKLADHLALHGKEIAAFVLEPLVQGASGMNMCTPRFLRELEKLVRSYGILIIYDEVMTGFGRVGEYFSCLKSETTPDIICASKTISGGFLPRAMTVCHEKVYAAFLSDNISTALIHGHTFTANPLACAASLASLKLLQRSETQAQLCMIENVHQQALAELAELSVVEKIRYTGTIAAFDLKIKAGYGSKASSTLQNRFLERGLLLRPLGNVVYFLPPYCVTEAELKNAYQIVIQEIQGVFA
jgi:adenosylmethionine-8-amino-7-oxononanoate aminotransferase